MTESIRRDRRFRLVHVSNDCRARSTHRFTTVRMLLISFLLFFFQPANNAVAVVPPSIEYLYIDSSEGNSSGGHAAIRFGEDVFHFQHFEPGVLRSVKDEARYFRYLYGFLDNRSIRASRIAVSDETWTLLRDYFNERNLIQNQQFGILQSLRDDQALIRLLLQRKRGAGGPPASAAGHSIRLPGVGLFFPDHIVAFNHPNTEQVPVARSPTGLSVSLQSLRKRVEQHYGTHFLAERMRDIRDRLRRLKPTEYDPGLLNLPEDRFPAMTYPFAQHYKDLMTALMGLKALQLALPLRSEAYVAPDLDLFRLNTREIELLAGFRQQLEKDLILLVNSRRPDWGMAFLVGMARLIVVEQSVRSGRLVFLDTFQTGDDVIDPEEIRQYGDLMREQLDAAKTRFQEARPGLLESQAMTEVDYSHFEHWSNRYLEVRRGVEQHRPIRIHSGHLMPTKGAARSDLIVPEASRRALTVNLAHTDLFRHSYADKLKQLYRYNLFTKNCVSEIFRTIHGAFESYLESKAAGGKASERFVERRAARVEAESVERLGGYLEAEGIRIIPYVSAHSVNRTYDIVSSAEWPSYRKAQLINVYEEDDPLLVFLRESNVISSTLYQRNPDDSFFVFFTDDAVLPRPLFGAINSVVGLGQSIVGLFMVPFDGGRVLSLGARGFLFSLPELVFFNIRKGSYRYLPYAWVAEDG